MDYELLIALCVLWSSSTWCLFTCAFMWMWNDGEGFHPHSVDLERRHSLFEVVRSNTLCKVDFSVKSVSEFIAPRLVQIFMSLDVCTHHKYIKITLTGDLHRINSLQYL